MQSRPVVSIITPMYNSSDFISSTIQSAISQTFCSWEMILVDDCSSDNSIELVNNFSAHDSRVRVISMAENSGAAVARNTAIEAARGRYIAFLDSDDVWLPRKLETQLAFMKKRNIAFSYAAYEKINEFGQPLGMMGVPGRINYSQILKCCVIGCLTAMYDTEKVGKVYMPLIRKRQDFGLWLRILRQVDYAYGIQEPLAVYRVRNGSISSNKAVAASYTWKLYREVEKLGVLKSGYYFSHYAVRGLLRQRLPTLAKKLRILD